MASEGPDIIEELASALGIEPGYYDMRGRWRETSSQGKATVIRSLGIEDPAACLSELKGRPWNRFLEPVMVVSVNRQPPHIPVHLPLLAEEEDASSLEWCVQDEAGRKEHRELRGLSPAASASVGGERYVRVELPNETNREMGYYTVAVVCRTPSGEFSGRMRLIVTPDRCHLPEGRSWGLSLNLYSVRSARNWGVGDLTDLKEIVVRAGRDLGCGFVGINPLHAVTNRMPFGISPYSSVSRLYRNYLYIDAEKVLKELPEGERLLEEEGFHREAGRLRETALIDYEACASIKLSALRRAFDLFREHHLEKATPEAADFKRYIEEEGQQLERFAMFMAIEERMRARGLKRWQDWPEQYRSPDAPGVEELKRTAPYDVLFYQYLQWLLERQLAEVGKAAGGMAVGLYQDLAVGSSGEGSDAWGNPSVLALGADIGAPPDAFNPTGQNWGFPPFIPHRLRESGYGLFIETVRKNLRHAGALRVDHALGLFRIFFVPEGMSPEEGTYLRQPAEELLRIIALESVRSKTVIIAEDLGMVTDEAREAFRRFGMLSYRLFYFERNWETGEFLPPHAWPETAFAAVTTHDLPTLHGFWAGRDIEVKRKLGLYPDEETGEKERADRERDRGRMLTTLADFLPEGFPLDPDKMPVVTETLNLAVHRLLARTPCLLVSVSLDDIAGELDQQNLPGVVAGYPSWRRKMRLETEEAFGLRLVRALVGMFREEGRAEGR